MMMPELKFNIMSNNVFVILFINEFSIKIYALHH